MNYIKNVSCGDIKLEKGLELIYKIDNIDLYFL